MNPLVHEILDVSEAEFKTDETSGKMSARVKIIQAGRAKGKARKYSSASIRKAAKEGVYDGIRMFVNHSDRPPTKRSIGELVSAVESTEYDAKADAVVGNIEFFNKDFFDYAQRAKKYMGVSADHRIRVNYVQEGSERIEDVQSVELARSVDWVVYPAAGGEVISFAREGEGAEDVEWADVTLDDLKANAPKLLETYQKEMAVKEGPEEDPEEDPEKDTKKVKKDEKVVSMTPEAIKALVQEQVQSIQTAADDTRKKQVAAGKSIREVVSKSGLPPRTQARVINQFAEALEYVEADVKEAIDDAKAELKEAGAGPRIKGMGATGDVKEGEEDSAYVSVKESVEASFGIKKDKKATTASSGKES